MERRVLVIAFSKLANILLYLYVFTIPWEACLTDSSFGTISRAVGALAILAGVLAVLSGYELRSLKPGHFLMLTFVIWICASYLWSIDVDTTLIRITTYIQLLLVTLFIWQFAVAEDQFQLILQAYVLGAIVASGFVFQNYYSGTGYESLTGRYSAEGFDPNYLGINLAYSITMACYLLQKFKNKLFSWINYPAIIFITFAIVLTGSRAALIVTSISYVMLLETIRRVDIRKKAVMLLLLTVCAFVLIPQVPKDTMDRLTGTASEVSSGDWSQRKNIWRSGVNVATSHIAIGVGSGAFPVGLRKECGISTEAHNTYLSVLAELGIVGLVLFFAIPVTALAGILRLRKTEKLFCIGLLCTFALGIVSLTSENLKTTWLILNLMIMASTFLGSSPHFKPYTSRKRSNQTRLMKA